MALVVIHGHDCIKLAVAQDHQRIGRVGAFNAKTGGDGLRHGRLDQCPFFVAEQARLAGMRVQGADADRRRRALERRIAPSASRIFGRSLPDSTSRTRRTAPYAA